MVVFPMTPSPAPDIVQHRNLKTPSPPKKVRRLLWTAPCAIWCITGSKRLNNVKGNTFTDTAVNQILPFFFFSILPLITIWIYRRNFCLVSDFFMYLLLIFFFIKIDIQILLDTFICFWSSCPFTKQIILMRKKVIFVRIKWRMVFFWDLVTL